MIPSTANATVGDLVTHRPSLSRVFEKFGIDYCCNGGDTLDDACRKAGADIALVSEAVQAHLATAPAEDDRNWSEASLTELVDHIQATHHAYLREELPRISELAAKVVAAHGEAYPFVRRLSDTYAGLRVELEMHMWKEENILFPIIRVLDSSEALADFHCGSVANPIRVMEYEHDNAGSALATMRSLTGGYTTPEGLCNTYRALMEALETLESDLHRHIHKENSILFPMAIAREIELAERTDMAAAS